MADANAPEAVEPSVKAEAFNTGAKAADIAAEAVTPAVEPPVPQPVAVKLPPKAKRAAKPKAAPAKMAAKPVRKPVGKTAASTESSISQLKDKIMATSKNADFAKGIQDAIADAQDKAKAAFEKGTASLGEVTEFTKGNVEALVESGKIFAAGAQTLGSTCAADSRAAFETLTADVKELASAKTPTDFFKLQGDLARRNFETAITAGSKNSEALFKLVNEAFAPISGRVSLAVDKFKQAA